MSNSGRHWIGTIPYDRWTKPDTLPCDVLYIRGQQEIGNGDSAYHHWQVLVSYGRTVRLAHVVKQFPGHWELTRSKAADAYVFKSETAVLDTQFELGSIN